jgi:hypothetical protein
MTLKAACDEEPSRKWWPIFVHDSPILTRHWDGIAGKMVVSWPENYLLVKGKASWGDSEFSEGVIAMQLPCHLWADRFTWWNHLPAANMRALLMSCPWNCRGTQYLSSQGAICGGRRMTELHLCSLAGRSREFRSLFSHLHLYGFRTHRFTDMAVSKTIKSTNWLKRRFSDRSILHVKLLSFLPRKYW